MASEKRREISLFDRGNAPKEYKNSQLCGSEVACLHIADFSFWAASRQCASASSTRSGTPLPSRCDALVIHDSGKVHSCSPFLRELGLQKGDPLERARGLFPPAELIARDPAIEGFALEELLETLNRHTPWMKRLEEPSLPGVWVLLDGLDLPELEDLVLDLRVQGGCAPYKSFSMLAAASRSIGGLQVLSRGDLMPFLQETPAATLESLGFAEALTESLQLLGFKNLGDCFRLTRRQLGARFGEEGLRLFELLHPEREETVPAFVPDSVTARHDFAWAVSRPEVLAPQLERLIDRALEELGDRLCSSVSVVLTARGKQVLSQHRMLKEPTSRKETLMRVTDRFLPEFFQQKPEVHRVELLLYELVGKTPFQTNLFPGKSDLNPLLERVERRFPGKLVRPVFHAPYSPFPEERFRYEAVLS